MQVVDEPLDERPEIKFAALELDSRLGFKVRILFDHLAYGASEMLDVPPQRLDHLGGASVVVVRRELQLQDLGGQGDCVQRGSQIMRHEREIFLAALLDFDRSLGRVSLYGQANRMVENPIDDMKWLALQAQAVAVSHVVNAAAEDVVLGDDFLDIEAILQAWSPWIGGLPSRSASGMVSVDLDSSASASSSSKPGTWSFSVGVSRSQAEGSCLTCSRQRESKESRSCLMSIAIRSRALVVISTLEENHERNRQP